MLCVSCLSLIYKLVNTLRELRAGVFEHCAPLKKGKKMEFFIGLFVLYILYKLLSGVKKSQSSQHPYKPEQYPSPVAPTSKTSPSCVSISSALSTQSKARNDLSYDDVEEELATFTIYTSYGREPTKTNNKQKGRWIGQNERITINDRKLNTGLFYYGEVLDALSGYGVEPSLVDNTLPASNPCSKIGSEIYTDETLGYWPSYASLSKGCRGAYLDWLASDRSDPDTPIGYVFIYFYGLERRVIENKSNAQIADREFLTLFEEVLRLNNVFSANRSFRGYSANFLELMALLRPTLLENRTREIPDTNNSLSFRVKLARKVVNEQLIDAQLALEWIKNTFEYSLKTPARRCEEEFRHLFKIRFNQKFGDGIAVKPNKTKLQLSYHAASNGIQGVELDMDDLPDPSILKAPIKKLIPIAEQCTEELNSFSRYLGKAGTARDDVAALMLLPNELVNESNSPIIESFKSWAKQILTNNNGITTVREFWSHTKAPFPTTLNKKEIELLTNLAAKADIGIAPDQRYHQAKFKIDDKIVLFSLGHGQFFEPSTAFNEISLAIRLGAMVATINGSVDTNEKLALQNLIDQDDKLSSAEKNSLNAYLTWRLNSPTNTTGLKARIQQLGAKQIEFIKKFIISIALADGKIDSSEIKQIEKLYTSLGLDKSLVTSDIHTLASTKHTALISTTDDITERKNTFLLDENVLTMHENDTNDAKSMLESIFSVDDEPEIEAPMLADVSQAELDSSHKELFEILIAKESWPRKEVYEFCSKLNLMVDGALETINDWAYEKVDAAVLDDDGDIYVDLEIVEELKG